MKHHTYACLTKEASSRTGRAGALFPPYSPWTDTTLNSLRLPVALGGCAGPLPEDKLRVEGDHVLRGPPTPLLSSSPISQPGLFSPSKQRGETLME